ncbi:hypothetical protein [Natrialba sp. SSL1]|uniref:hypothetical protein n=1 Tax=Natrialba sp. SSL1 TaxID=1869245 RepID=UPI0008F8EC4F|nr:hypothetical protein [Natrialba sp. SSL1]OIB56487.1 hypothetical protein BBD46_17840 [Natrialba sp. SSL1]
MSRIVTSVSAICLFIGGTLALAIVLALVLLPQPTLPLSSCTDVGYVGGPPGGFEYEGYSWLWLEYSPDGGVNRCGTPIVSVAVGLLVVGGVLFGIDRRTQSFDR